MKNLHQFKLFDSHFHIIDQRFPLISNQGFIPDNFSINDYKTRTRHYDIGGGAIVCGSFQAFDQTYLLAALKELGPGFAGVAQLPATVSDGELVDLNEAGVRAVRFNLKRGGSERVENLERFAMRVHETVGWHTELYVDAKDLPDLHQFLVKLPAVSIDHLGLTAAGLPALLALVEKGVYVKATGFGRVDFEVGEVLRAITATNPQALIFGTDLPSTRAPEPYSDADFFRVIDALGEELASRVFYQNAINLYRPRSLKQNA
ncbi:amidohydrolase family protein [Geopsychrobacter electrodiphilus]|uniref:amidohydrolase family protein n=1 Tax=Geopsychrobacter electrodiphilus TaxID=225196 RepID=UPI000363F68E|nr:amidohydrolase family protein [Geopsychrobacter electrodiphilus]